MSANEFLRDRQSLMQQIPISEGTQRSYQLGCSVSGRL